MYVWSDREQWLVPIHLSTRTWGLEPTTYLDSSEIPYIINSSGAVCVSVGGLWALYVMVEEKSAHKVDDKELRAIIYDYIRLEGVGGGWGGGGGGGIIILNAEIHVTRSTRLGSVQATQQQQLYCSWWANKEHCDERVVWMVVYSISGQPTTTTWFVGQVGLNPDKIRRTYDNNSPIPSPMMTLEG